MKWASRRLLPLACLFVATGVVATPAPHVLAGDPSQTNPPAPSFAETVQYINQKLAASEYHVRVSRKSAARPRLASIQGTDCSSLRCALDTKYTFIWGATRCVMRCRGNFDAPPSSYTSVSVQGGDVVVAMNRVVSIADFCEVHQEDTEGDCKAFPRRWEHEASDARDKLAVGDGPDVDKLGRALAHLRTLCGGARDPFE